MDITYLSYLLLAVAGFSAGVMNAVAGGGTFLTFPALIFAGVPPIVANVSSTVALFPGSFASAWAYRANFRNFEGISLPVLLGVNFAGGATGAILLLVTSQRAFDVVIPWLLLFASLIFAFGPKLAPRLRQAIEIGPTTLLILQFIVGIYGGYFGGAVGILMMAAWSLMSEANLKVMGPTRTVVVAGANTTAVALFLFSGQVWWIETAVMIAGAVIGGFAGAHGARRLSHQHIRMGVIVLSVVMTAAFFARRWL